MSLAYIAYTNKKGIIKSVAINTGGCLDELGISLIEYFKDISDVKTLVSTTIDYIDEDQVEYAEDDEVYEEYESDDDFIHDMNSFSYYYLYQKDTWYVSKPNQYNFEELESVLEGEF